MMTLPLQGLLVLEFSQYLSGPSAGLRLADLGARVIKIEKPGKGDAGRKLAIKDLWSGDDSLLFHTINRNKESFAANLKNEEDLAIVKKLIAKADVLIHNFRPNVMEKIGLGFEAVQLINPRLIYAAISGYGTTGPWKDKPGQDLLLQSISGLAYTTGNQQNNPVPFGLSIGDIMAGSQLVQGILGGLIRRHRNGKGALIEVSMLESLLDFQFELLTTYFTTSVQPQRCNIANGQPLLGAPYGLYKTADTYIAIAMMDIHLLGKTIECTGLISFSSEEVFTKRDTIKKVLAGHLKMHPAAYWLEKLHKAGLWAMQVLNWQQMVKTPAYLSLEMEQKVITGNGYLTTTRCPIRINQTKFYSSKPAPLVGEHNQKILQELGR